jgi:tRNA-Thr(GGU) m(6)t(6)A37 methyltransferase TsaA
MEKIQLTPIGVIHTPFTERSHAPRGPSAANGAEGRVVVYPEFAEGLKDVDGFSHLILVFYLDRSEIAPLRVRPEHSPAEHGVFATRSPDRPNHLGISVVELDRIEGATLHVRNVDMLDGTPLVDIKPYSPLREPHAAIRQGWIDETHAAGETHA